MTSELNYKALRTLPRAMLGMFCALPILIVITFIIISVSFNSNVQHENIYSVLGGFVSFIFFANYICVLIILVCLYALSEVTKWFKYSWLCLILYFLFMMISQVLFWVKDITQNHIAVKILAYLFFVVPEIFIITGVYFLIIGMRDISQKIGNKAMEKTCESNKKNWMVLSILKVIFYLSSCVVTIAMDAKNLIIFSHTQRASIVLIVYLGISIMLFLWHMVIGWKIYVKSSLVCQEYYLYHYNNM